MTNPLTDAMEARIEELLLKALNAFRVDNNERPSVAIREALRTAAREAAAAENEACALLCEAQADYARTARECAADIRARREAA